MLQLSRLAAKSSGDGDTLKPGGILQTAPHDLRTQGSSSLGKDERQSLFLSAEAAALITPPPPREADAELTFTNVPFEEHKLKRGGAAGAGGSQTKWYS